MRDVRFRAWDKDMKEMLRVDQITFVHNATGFGKGILDEHNDWHSFDEIELMQWTGLYDRNNAPIYEGDILKSNYIQKLFKVEWIDIAAGFEIPYGIDKCEVVGNIYENPDLLEEHHA